MAKPTLPTEVLAAAEREGFDAAEYNAVALHARLATIRLVTLNLETSPGITDDAMDPELAFSRQVQSCRYDATAESAAAIFRFGVSVRRPAGEAFSCVADYAVLYEMPKHATPEAATSFCKHVGSFAAYPYFRALAAQMAWNAGVDLPPLPTIAAMPVVSRPTEPASPNVSAKPAAGSDRSKRKPAPRSPQKPATE